MYVTMYALGCLLLHRFIKDDYLQQNSFTKYDKYCPFYKSVEMMRNIATFHRLATAAVEKTAQGNSEGQKITYNVIKQRMGDVLYKLTSQKFEDPGRFGDATLVACLPRNGIDHPLLTGRLIDASSACAIVFFAAEGEEVLRRKLRAVNEELVERFRQLEEEFR